MYNEAHRRCKLGRVRSAASGSETSFSSLFCVGFGRAQRPSFICDVGFKLVMKSEAFEMPKERHKRRDA